MAKTRKQKEKILSKYQELINTAKAVFLISANLNGNETTGLRKKLNDFNAKFHLLKNSLITLAIKNTLNKSLVLTGKVSGVFVHGDIAEAAKCIEELKKEGKAIYINSIFEGDIKSGDFIEKLAKLESKEVLLSKLVYLVNYPTTGLARSLSNNIQKLIYALEAVKASKN